jgi:two-component system, OmpR family, response regulator
MGETSLDSPDLRESEDRQVCVLVVEDDAALQRMILNYFRENNIRTLVASSRQEMVDQLAGTEVNLVILDLRLGQEDGLDLLREVRSSSDVPVIIITGHRRDDIDRVVGLELGADDYLTKPFNLRELLARVRAVLRRFDVGRVAPRRDPEHGRFRFGGWQLDCKTRRLTDPAGYRIGRFITLRGPARIIVSKDGITVQAGHPVDVSQETCTVVQESKFQGGIVARGVSIRK